MPSGRGEVAFSQNGVDNLVLVFIMHWKQNPSFESRPFPSSFPPPSFKQNNNDTLTKTLQQQRNEIQRTITGE